MPVRLLCKSGPVCHKCSLVYAWNDGQHHKLIDDKKNINSTRYIFIDLFICTFKKQRVLFTMNISPGKPKAQLMILPLGLANYEENTVGIIKNPKEVKLRVND